MTRVPCTVLQRQRKAAAQRTTGRSGSSFSAPAVRGKYRPIEWLFGYPTAVAAMRVLPRLRDQAACKWDEYVYRFTSPSSHEPNPQQS